MQNQEQLAHNLLKIFISLVKGGTSWRNKESLSEHLQQSGFTGIFTGLDRYYNSIEELHDVLYEMWDEFD